MSENNVVIYADNKCIDTIFVVPVAANWSSWPSGFLFAVHIISGSRDNLGNIFYRTQCQPNVAETHKRLNSGILYDEYCMTKFFSSVKS